jgi:hypothetical protein
MRADVNKLLQHPARRLALVCMAVALLWIAPAVGARAARSSAPLEPLAATYASRSFVDYNLVVNYQPADARWVEDVAARTDTARRILNRTMPDALLAQIRVIVAPTQRDFLRLAGGWAEHAVAVAIQTRPVPTVIINAELLRTVTPIDFSRTLVHELSHCYLGLRLKAPAPRWFEEGVAMIAADEGTFEDAAAVALAALLNRTIPLRELAYQFPSGADRQRLAYRQSASVVRFLMDENGGTLAKFLEPFVGPDSERRVAELWNPMYVEPLELRWKSSMRSWRNWFFLASSSGFFWGAVALLTLLAWLVKRRRNALRRREWEEEERIYEVLDEAEAQEGGEEEDVPEDEDNEPRPPWYS